MTDKNAFDDLVPDSPRGSNAFDDLVPQDPIADTSTFGAFGRSAAQGAAPAAGSLAGAGAGAEVGAELGSFAGPFGALGGGVIGGLVGGFGGSYLTEKAQDYAIKKLPDTWQDALEKQQRADATAHPYASFIGGNVPFLMTMKPWGSPANVAQNATSLQRLMAHPVTSRLFGGAVMGGMELGQEAADGDVDANKVAIATGLGVVFNHTNRIGEGLTELGAAPVRRGASLIQGNAHRVIGPGVTEQVFQGDEERSPEAEQAAQQDAREEAAATGETPPGPDLNDLARRMEPETFTVYDELTKQRDALRAHLDALAYPPDEKVADAQSAKSDLEEQLRAHLEDRGGYTAGPEARRFRAQIRAAQGDIDELMARRAAHDAGEGVETEEMAQARQQLLQIDAQMRDAGRDVAAAYRRAAEAAHGETVEETKPPEAAQPEQPAPEETPKPATADAEPESPKVIPAAAEAGPEPQDVAAQRAWIAEDMRRRLVAAGRPREEAEAAAEVVAARYVTRAQRMGGAIGTPEQLYFREHPDVRGPDGRMIRANTPPSGTGETRGRKPRRGEGPAHEHVEPPKPAPAPEVAKVEPEPAIKPAAEPAAAREPEPAISTAAALDPTTESRISYADRAVAEGKSRIEALKEWEAANKAKTAEPQPERAPEPAKPAEPARVVEPKTPGKDRIGDLKFVRKRGSNLMTGGYDNLVAVRVHKLDRKGEPNEFVDRDGKIIKKKDAFQVYRAPEGVDHAAADRAMPNGFLPFGEALQALKAERNRSAAPDSISQIDAKIEEFIGLKADINRKIAEQGMVTDSRDEERLRNVTKTLNELRAERDRAAQPSPSAGENAISAPTETSANEPAKLDQRGESSLEGVAPEGVQSLAEGGAAGAGVDGSGGTDVQRDAGVDEERLSGTRSLGDREAGIPVHAAGEPAEGGAAGERSGETEPRDQPSQEQSARDASRDVDADPAGGRPAQQVPSDFAVTDEDNVGGTAEEGGFKAKQKFRDNIAAIETLFRLENAKEAPTRDDQAILAKWVGWGGLPQAFRRSDGTFSKGWEREGARLEALLSPEHLKAAEASTRNAHYTSPEIVKGMWAALKRMGFDGGRVLEPSMGVGNFFGLMPKELRAASALNGVELDPITGGIAKLLYPSAKIAAPMSFVDYTFPNDHFDTVIGNPPFGAEKLFDPARRDLSKFSIHNYFFAKAMDGVRPGGIMSMVVTNRFLDGAKDAARQYLADRADLVGAIRLPNKAFSKNANTEVTTDIIFLRRRGEGEARGGEPWLNVVEHTDKNGAVVPLNEYFAKHPEQMLGDFGAFGSMYREGDPALIAREGQDTAMMLDEAITRLPRDIVTGDKAKVQPERIPVTADLTNVRVGSMFKQDGRLYVRAEDSLGERQASPIELEGKAYDRAAGLVDVRDSFATLRRLQLDPSATDAQISAARADLNTVYDKFVKEHGFLNSQANARVFHDDPSWPQIAALEEGYDRGISKAVAKTTGEAEKPESAKKASVFSKRTQRPYEPVTTAATAKDALVASLADKGKVDLDHMERLYGKPQAEIIKELGDLVYSDPVKGWVSSDEYLSGNVKKKLAEARALAEREPTMERNVRALEAVQPADIDAVDISIKPGSHWIPRGIMEDFARHVSGAGRVDAMFNPESNKWAFRFRDSPTTDAQTRWATDRRRVDDILDAVANQSEIIVRDRDPNDRDKTIVNEAATQAAKEKVNAVREEWNRWIYEDDARREQLSHLYNDMFNTDVQRKFDGSHLSFPGKVDDSIISLRPHQKNAIWRMMQSGTTLLDHVVGAGKTFTMIGGAMEMRRTGQARKPMFVVPNHLVLQWAKDFVKLYPGANILAASKNDFEAGKRKKLIARVATGDWDAVIVPHSSFGKIEVDPKAQGEYIDEQVADLEDSIRATQEAEGKDSKNVKQIQKRIQTLREKQKELLDTGRKDDSLYFDELGVDGLFLDEAHEFKNLAYATSMSRVAGLGSKEGSQKASDMHLKVQQVLKSTGGRNVVFATGTPISNTMAEMYTMQRYLDGKVLAEQGLRHFDAWARMFGEVVTDWEISPAGKYKLNSRFAKFNNLPELMQRYQSFADVINHDDIKRMLAEQGKTLPIPKVEGGKPNNVVVERSPEQSAYIGVPRKDANGNESYPEGSLIWRSENLPKKRIPEPGDDNMLKIMSDARKAALDMRLIDPNASDYRGSKVNVAADSIRRIYEQSTPDRGGQLVFCDLSTPKGAVAKERATLRELIEKAESGDEAARAKLDAMSPDEIEALNSEFSVYDDLKQKLIDRGIPEKEIAFIHEANTDLQKDTLFGKVRSGQIRVLMGSTAKMGAGMNVQERLVALHHLDAPWRPSDLEQREGRIIRQGNVLYERDPDNFRVGIHRYATKETLDARMWQTLEGKATFIEQVRKAQPGVRTVEDVGGEAMNSAEMKAAASGNPKILEEMQLRRKMKEMTTEESNFKREQHRVKDTIKAAEGYARDAQERASVRETDAARQIPEKFEAKVGGQSFDKRTEAGDAILKQATQMEKSGEKHREIGSYGDFKLNLNRVPYFTGDRVESEYMLELEGAGRYRAKSTFNLGSDATSVAMRMNGAVQDAREIEGHRNAATNSLETAKRLRSQIVDSWPKYNDLQELRKQHEALVQELRGNKPLPDGYTVKAPGEGTNEWTVISPDGETVGKGLSESAARNDFLTQASAKAPQEQEYQQRQQGRINIRKGQRSIITLAKSADASTFMHEEAHDWLEQLFRDATHEAAPEAIRIDAETTRKWLGLDEDAEPKTREHEKFARGFEQYLREGRAPTTALARVFAKFKGWLTQIYQTLKGLGAPINDDIRGVFDRMLDSGADRTVVAPEPVRAPSLADIHEADAAHIDPQEAEPAARRVDAERKQAEQETPPEIAEAANAAQAEKAEAPEPEQAQTRTPVEQMSREDLEAELASFGMDAPSFAKEEMKFSRFEAALKIAADCLSGAGGGSQSVNFVRNPETGLVEGAAFSNGMTKMNFVRDPSTGRITGASLGAGKANLNFVRDPATGRITGAEIK